MESKVSRCIAGIIIAIIAIGLIFLMLPANTLRASETWWFIFLIAVIATIIFAIAEYFSDEIMALTIVSVICGCICLIALLIGGLSGAEMFNAEKYHNLIEIEDGVFAEDISRIEESYCIPIVDVATAQKVGDRTVGTIENATWYEVSDEYNLIKYQGKYYRV